jgi:EAL domain-containing protein (putative c-di-GMP-specific phosphodiesterase class I)
MTPRASGQSAAPTEGSRDSVAQDSHEKGMATRQLISALQRDQFVLYGQPILSVQPQRRGTRYIEILVRHLEEEQKLMPPGTFIPILEEAGLMPLLDRWVLKALLKWMTAQRNEAPNRALPRASVNLSTDSLKDPHFAAFVRQQVVESSVPADRISFELSLRNIRLHREKATAVAQMLRPLGCPLAISGFTGNIASLKGYAQAGVRIIKLEGSLIRGLRQKEAVFEKLKAIAATCKELGMRTVAEMVEEPGTVTQLGDAGIDYAQGFGVALPLPLQSYR